MVDLGEGMVGVSLSFCVWFAKQTITLSEVEGRRVHRSMHGLNQMRHSPTIP
jgi:hypothetical protein